MPTHETLSKAPKAPEVPGVTVPTVFRTDAEKLDAGWTYVTIPDRDPYDFLFDGIYLNNEHFKPGKHLVSPDVAASLEERLKAWNDYNVRLMRPQQHAASLAQATKGK